MEELKAKSLLTENLNFTSEDIEKIELFNILLLEYNKRYNLISKSSESVIWERHVLDSAQITKFIDFKEFGSLSDLGTGGGFPGIILSIYNKNLKFHVKLYEKSAVKTDFLQKIKQKLELKFELINSDIYRIKIASNYIVCRAFKKLPEILKISREICNKKHKLIILKGKSAQEEVNKALMKEEFEYKLVDSITNKESKIIIIDVKKSE